MLTSMTYESLLHSDIYRFDNWTDFLLVECNNQPFSKIFATDALVTPFLQNFEDLQYGDNQSRPEDSMALVDQIENSVARYVAPKIQCPRLPQFVSPREVSVTHRIPSIDQQFYCNAVKEYLRTRSVPRVQPSAVRSPTERKNPFADDYEYSNDILPHHPEYASKVLAWMYHGRTPTAHKTSSLRHNIHMSNGKRYYTPHKLTSSIHLGPYSNFSDELQVTPNTPTPLPRAGKKRRTMAGSDDEDDKNYNVSNDANDENEIFRKKGKLGKEVLTPTRKSAGTRSSRRLAGLNPDAKAL